MSHPPRPRFEIGDESCSSLEDADAIRSRMRRLRAELNSEVEAAKNEASSFFDWKSYVASRPLTCVALAAAAGYLLAPQTKRVLQLSDSQLERLAMMGGVNVTTQTTGGSTSTAKSLLATAGAFGLRFALGRVMQHVTQGADPSLSDTTNLPST